MTVNSKMDQVGVVESCPGTLYTTWMSVRNTMLGEKSRSRKNAYCAIAFIESKTRCKAKQYISKDTNTCGVSHTQSVKESRDVINKFGFMAPSDGEARGWSRGGTGRR